jgi:AcrR family transcriptional regulator
MQLIWDPMNDLLADSAFATELLPGKFKFTSQQGRTRRMQLLTAARELLCERNPEDVSFADVCECAGIPRASAYHFFPNIQSVFVGLRLLHAHSMLNALENTGSLPGESWRGFFCRIVDIGVSVMRDEPAATKLIYGGLGGMLEAQQLGRELDARLARLTLDGMARHFELPDWPEREPIVAIAFTIVDSVFRLSYRRSGEITPWMVEEAKRAAIAYLRNYLPEYLPARRRETLPAAETLLK